MTSHGPSPQVIAVYRALRDSTHAHRLGFVAAPLVLVGLSAGGNLAVASVIAPLIKGLRAQGDVNGSGADGTDCTWLQLIATDCI